MDSCIGFEVLTAVVIKSTIFWDITPCSPLSVNRRFGGTHRFHLQGVKNKQVASLPAFSLFSFSANFFDPEDGDDMFLRNVGYIPEDGTLHGFVCRNISSGM
jgi:hypothetical protein